MTSPDASDAPSPEGADPVHHIDGAEPAVGPEPARVDPQAGDSAETSGTADESQTDVSRRTASSRRSSTHHPKSSPGWPMDPTRDFQTQQLLALGAYIREQRLRAQLSLRQLAELANVSNPYLSQIERGLHEPSVRVLKAIAAGLDLSAEVILAEAGLLERAAGLDTGPTSDEGNGRVEGRPAVEVAIDRDPMLTAEQKGALIQVYRSYLASRRSRR